MSNWLLDTNALSDAIRNPGGAVVRRIAAVGESNICTSIVVAAELRFGAARKGSVRLTERLEAVLARMDVRALEAPADAAYGKLWAELEARGTIIGANALLIAAHALCLSAIIVTDNVREFERVPGLRCENWLRD